MISNKPDTTYSLAFSLVLYLSTNILLVPLFFIFSLGSLSPVFYISISVSILYLIWIYGENRLLYKQIFVFTIIIGLSIYLSLIIHDFSWDGNSYHKNAILHLAGGWNPIYQNPPEIMMKWSEIYPKAVWYYGASLTSVFERSEASKSINYITSVLLFITSLKLFKLFNLKSSTSLVISSIIVFNPVSILQLFTNYVDVVLYNLFVTVVIVYFLKRVDDKKGYNLIIALLLLILAFIKYSSLIFFAVILIMILLFEHYKSTIKPDRLNKYAVLFLVLVIIVGFNPYVTNAINYGDPVYPILSNEQMAESIIESQISEEFENLHPVKQFFYSHFSHTQIWLNEGLPNVKIPFTVTGTEIMQMANPGVRIGGFGPFFGGALILSLLLLIAELILKPRNIYFIVVILVLSGATVLNLESWWARLAPHIWLFPVAISIYGIKLNGWLKRGGILILSILALNIVISAIPNTLLQLSNELKLRQETRLLKSSISPDDELVIDINAKWLSAEERVENYDIPYRINNDLQCENSNRVLKIPDTQYCIENLPQESREKIIALREEWYIHYLFGKIDL